MIIDQNFLIRLILWSPVILILLSLFRVSHRLYVFQRTDFNKIDRMSGESFEKYLVNLFINIGYNVEHIGKLGDYGGDLIIEKDGVKTLVQAKRSDLPIRENAVQQALAAKAYYKCEKALVVTNNYFYRHAQNLAQATKVELWTREELEKVILGNY